MLLDWLLLLLLLQPALGQLGFGSLSLALAPFPFLYAVIAAESSAWKQHFTPDYQPLEMTQDLHVASLQIFFLACLDQEVSEGLYKKRTFCTLISLLPARAAPAKLNYRAPTQATPNIRNLPTCPSLFSSRLCCFSRAFLQGSRRRDELCPSLILFVPRASCLAEFKQFCTAFPLLQPQ